MAFRKDVSSWIALERFGQDQIETLWQTIAHFESRAHVLARLPPDSERYCWRQTIKDTMSAYLSYFAGNFNKSEDKIFPVITLCP